MAQVGRTKFTGNSHKNYLLWHSPTPSTK